MYCMDSILAFNFKNAVQWNSPDTYYMPGIVKATPS